MFLLHFWNHEENIFEGSRHVMTIKHHKTWFFLCKTIATGSVCGKNVDEKMKSNHWGKTRPFGLAPLPEAWSKFWGSRSQRGETDLPADASSAHSLFTRPIKIWQSFCNHWLSMKANSYFHSYSNNLYLTPCALS